MNVEDVIEAARTVAKEMDDGTQWNYDPIECAALRATANGFRRLAEILASTTGTGA